MSDWGQEYQYPHRHATYAPINPGPVSQPGPSSISAQGPILHAANNLEEAASNRRRLAWEGVGNESAKIARMAQPSAPLPYHGTGIPNLTYEISVARYKVDSANSDAVNGVMELAKGYDDGVPISLREYEANIAQRSAAHSRSRQKS